MSMEVGASDHLSFDGRRLVLPPGMTVTEQRPGDGDATLSLSGSRAFVGTTSPASGLTAGTEYAWFQTDGVGGLIDIWTGVA